MMIGHFHPFLPSLVIGTVNPHCPSFDQAAPSFSPVDPLFAGAEPSLLTGVFARREGGGGSGGAVKPTEWIFDLNTQLGKTLAAEVLANAKKGDTEDDLATAFCAQFWIATLRGRSRAGDPEWEESLDEVLQAASRTSDPVRQSVTLKTVAKAYARLGLREKTLRLLKEPALPIHHHLFVCRGLADTLLKRGDVEQAREIALEMALPLAKDRVAARDAEWEDQKAAYALAGTLVALQLPEEARSLLLRIGQEALKDWMDSHDSHDDRLEAEHDDIEEAVIALSAAGFAEDATVFLLESFVPAVQSASLSGVQRAGTVLFAVRALVELKHPDEARDLWRKLWAFDDWEGDRFLQDVAEKALFQWGFDEELLAFTKERVKARLAPRGSEGSS